VSDKVLEYAESVQRSLVAAGLRAELDRRPEKVGAKIRDAEMEKVPYMLVVGPARRRPAPSRCACTTRATRARSAWEPSRNEPGSR